MNKEEQNKKFGYRCIEALKLTERVLEASIPEVHPATHPAYSKIFELALQEIEKTEEE